MADIADQMDLNPDQIRRLLYLINKEYEDAEAAVSARYEKTLMDKQSEITELSGDLGEARGRAQRAEVLVSQLEARLKDAVTQRADDAASNDRTFIDNLMRQRDEAVERALQAERAMTTQKAAHERNVAAWRTELEQRIHAVQEREDAAMERLHQERLRYEKEVREQCRRDLRSREEALAAAEAAVRRRDAEMTQKLHDVEEATKKQGASVLAERTARMHVLSTELGEAKARAQRAEEANRQLEEKLSEALQRVAEMEGLEIGERETAEAIMVERDRAVERAVHAERAATVAMAAHERNVSAWRAELERRLEDVSEKEEAAMARVHDERLKYEREVREKASAEMREKEHAMQLRFEAAYAQHAQLLEAEVAKRRAVEKAGETRDGERAARLKVEEELAVLKGEHEALQAAQGRFEVDTVERVQKHFVARLDEIQARHVKEMESLTAKVVENEHARLAEQLAEKASRGGARRVVEGVDSEMMREIDDLKERLEEKEAELAQLIDAGVNDAVQRGGKGGATGGGGRGGEGKRGGGGGGEGAVCDAKLSDEIEACLKALQQQWTMLEVCEWERSVFLFQKIDLERLQLVDADAHGGEHDGSVSARGRSGSGGWGGGGTGAKKPTERPVIAGGCRIIVAAMRAEIERLNLKAPLHEKVARREVMQQRLRSKRLTERQRSDLAASLRELDAVLLRQLDRFEMETRSAFLYKEKDYADVLRKESLR